MDGKKKDMEDADEPMKQKDEAEQMDENKASENVGQLGGEAEYEEYGPEFYSETEEVEVTPAPESVETTEEDDTSTDITED